MGQETDLLFHAEQVARQAELLGNNLLVIGAAALAGQGYVRLTRDIDLAGNLPLQRLRDLSAALAETGYNAELREPDAGDPLAGVLDIQGSFGQIQVRRFGWDRSPVRSISGCRICGNPPGDGPLNRPL